MSDLHSRNTEEIMFIAHEDDCAGSKCPGCGCCVHCADDCPCPEVEKCNDDICGCGDNGYFQARA